MIEVVELGKVFGGRGERVVAVARVSFSCEPGQVFGLLGANGAGKTTILRMLATLLHPTSGRATVGGADVVTASAQVRRQIAFLSTATALYGRLTAEEMVLYFGRLQGMGEERLRERLDQLFRELEIDSFRHRKCEQCSTGMKQRISIARALIHDPAVMIFDEPTLGLDVMAARQVTTFIRSCRDQGKTVLFSTHVMSEVEKLCDRVAIVHEGRIRAEGTVPELRERFAEEDMEEVFIQAVAKGGSGI